MKMEEWRDIQDFPGYQVSNQGRVRSFKVYKKGQNRKTDSLTETPHIMSCESDDGNGYLKVMLRKEGRSYCRKVHRLVAEAFVENPNPEIFDTVDHISNIKKDNRAENLRWISRESNVRKAYECGLCDRRIRNSRKGVLLRNIFSNEEFFFPSFGETADFLEVDPSTVSHAFGGGEYARLRDYDMWLAVTSR